MGFLRRPQNLKKILFVLLTRASCFVRATAHLSKSRWRFFKTNVVKSYYTNFNYLPSLIFMLCLLFCRNILWMPKISAKSMWMKAEFCTSTGDLSQTSQPLTLSLWRPCLIMRSGIWIYYSTSGITYFLM